MIIILDNTNREQVQGALYNHFIKLNATIIYKYIEDTLLIDVRPIKLNVAYPEFDLDTFKQDFKHCILYIDHKANLT